MSLLPHGPRAALALEDGSVRVGRAFGAVEASAAGEVVFHTGMSGYPEILTDPSYRGQVVVLTYPHAGNYRMPPDDDESGRIQVAGLVVKELCRHPSGVRSGPPLEEVLAGAGVMGLEGVDTRALTLALRERGALRGIVARVEEEGPDPATRAALVERARAVPSMEGADLATAATCGEVRVLEPESEADHHVVLLHMGAKDSIAARLVERGCRVTVVPAHHGPEEILALRPDGILVSNGPGDPAACTRAVHTLKALLGRRPLLGICLGHQLLALAAGARTVKLPFGHHGANHPVREEADGRIAISSQNHGFAVVEESLVGTGFAVTHRSLYDRTVEGIASPELRAQGIQYHPEAAPGPHDARVVFDRFVASMAAERNG